MKRFFVFLLGFLFIFNLLLPKNIYAIPCPSVPEGTCRTGGCKDTEHPDNRGGCRGATCCVSGPVIVGAPCPENPQGTCETVCQRNERIDSAGLCEGEYTCCVIQSSGGGDEEAPVDDSVGCGGNISNGINTAIGCIPINDPNTFAGWILGWAIGIGGGIAFILVLVAGFMITTSQGDPKKLQAGRELLTSAIGGLILLIFSVFVLKVTGVDILGIPGFGV
ncbi:MAG: hypothetical protein AAB546_00525 [Patescibacteria group bacterium]